MKLKIILKLDLEIQFIGVYVRTGVCMYVYVYFLYMYKITVGRMVIFVWKPFFHLAQSYFLRVYLLVLGILLP